MEGHNKTLAMDQKYEKPTNRIVHHTEDLPENTYS